MLEATEVKKTVKIHSRRLHMANERTFLSWIRTSIGLMAFGFVIEKFSLFVKLVSYSLNEPSPGNNMILESVKKVVEPHNGGYLSSFGMFLVIFGALTGVLAFIRYRRAEKQIDEDAYRPSSILDLMITTLILVTGIFLAIYLESGI